ncbi:DNA replication terminus site-binding protein [Zobellella taiwanensis]|jgi:DNA replication terminus site-binding protein|uniref:DNA replication terminus site-binding protein n=1 Tax=Zobellella taiwanensis TaxID=347535 RepID=A0A2P7RAE5_9GAMM|nr:DNA replication terminus site-binding protein [Zobellella taiwanensis]PSJ47160.1 DNA replication terminus site-binding protein [Zobellella taiwanensis]
MMMFTLAAQLRDTLLQLENAMADLGQWLRHSAGEHPDAACYLLPDTPLGQEHEPIDTIAIQGRLTGRDALEASINAYTRWHLQPDCSAKASFRLPGYICLPAGAAPELAPRIEHINRLKQSFRDQVQQLGSRDRKFALVHDTLPGLITLQVYRKLVLLPRPAARLGFTWANKQIIRKLDKSELVGQLTQARLTPPPLVDAQTWQQCVDREIYDVKRLPPGVELRLRRPVKTHPMVNVRWMEENQPRQQQFKAHLPLLLCQDSPARVTPLGDYPPARRRQRRAAEIDGEPLIPRLHIYPYRP